MLYTAVISCTPVCGNKLQTIFNKKHIFNANKKRHNYEKDRYLSQTSPNLH